MSALSFYLNSYIGHLSGLNLIFLLLIILAVSTPELITSWQQLHKYNQCVLPTCSADFSTVGTDSGQSVVSQVQTVLPRTEPNSDCGQNYCWLLLIIVTGWICHGSQDGNHNLDIWRGHTFLWAIRSLSAVMNWYVFGILWATKDKIIMLAVVTWPAWSNYHILILQKLSRWKVVIK